MQLAVNVVSQIKTRQTHPGSCGGLLHARERLVGDDLVRNMQLSAT